MNLNNKTLLPSSTAFVTGILLSIMLFFNGALGDITNIYFSSLYFHSIGTLTFVILAYIVFPRTYTKSHIKYIVPGVMNAVVIMGSSLVIVKLGVTMFVGISLLGQLVASLIVDSFGLFGKAKLHITYQKIIGLVIILAGVTLLV